MSCVKIILLIVLAMMVTACITVFILGSTGPAVPYHPVESHLPAAALILVVLLAILSVSGLIGDLIRGITMKADGTRNTGALVGVSVGILLGVIAGGFAFQFLAMLAD